MLMSMDYSKTIFLFHIFFQSFCPIDFQFYRKLQLEIDSHRRQEKLKEKQQQQQSEGTARSGSTTRDDRSSGTQTLPNRGSTGSAVKRPKAKVAPRVKSSASNQGFRKLYNLLH